MEFTNDQVEKLNKKVKSLALKNKELESEYQKLSNSILGKLQLNLWKFCKTIHYKLYRLKMLVFNFIRSSKFLMTVFGKIIENYQASSLQKREKLEVSKRKIFIQNTDITFNDTITEKTKTISKSNGCKFYKPSKVKIGIIADEFLYVSLKNSADFVYITPDNTDDILNCDVFMIASTWRGLDNCWRGIAHFNDDMRNLVLKLIKKAKENNIKTVFYSKEDPPNYSIFLDIAKQCEYIFTSCQEVISKYKKDCKNENVFLMEFSINPLYHNPIGVKSFKNNQSVIFSGSWMPKYPKRNNSMQMMFSGVLDAEFDLKIVDRNYDLSMFSFKFPTQYWSYVSPALKHDVLQLAHKTYDWAININSVTESQTMFANRGYELQATGNLIISNYSVGMNSRLPLVYTVHSKEDVGLILNSLDENAIFKRQLTGVRSVLTNETCFDRTAKLLTNIGFNQCVTSRNVLVLVDIINENILKSFNQQSYQNKEICTFKNFTHELKSNYDIIALFDEKCEYSHFYLEDMINAFKYTNVSFVTKDSYYIGDELIFGIEHDYVNTIKNKYCTILWSDDFAFEEILAFDCSNKTGYSIDRFEFNINAKLATKPELKQAKLTVFVPIHNNSHLFYAKAYSSIMRSSIDIDIILISFNQTQETLNHINWIKSDNPNISVINVNSDESFENIVYEFSKNLSTNYFTILNPKNEILKDGYCKMLTEAEKNECDLIFSNKYVFTEKKTEIDYIKNPNLIQNTDFQNVIIGTTIVNKLSTNADFTVDNCIKNAQNYKILSNIYNIEYKI